MTRFILLAAAALTSTAASAQDISIEGHVFGGSWFNEPGAFGSLDNGGIDDEDTRSVFDSGLAFGRDVGAGTVGLDLRYANYGSPDPSLDVDDTTDWHGDVTLRYAVDTTFGRAGAFAGYGQHNDNGDSDEKMTYRFGGLELGRAYGATDTFVQAGLLDSTDEYDEGTQDAVFVRLGATRAFGGFTVSGALAGARGEKYGDSCCDAEVLDLELEVARSFDGTPWEVYAGYDATYVGYDDGDEYGDLIQTVGIGLRFNFGGARRMNSLPQVGRWVAYNANEIE